MNQTQIPDLGSLGGRGPQRGPSSAHPSDAALPELAVRQLRDVHHHGVSLAQVDLLQVVFIALVLGEVDKHLEEESQEVKGQSLATENPNLPVVFEIGSGILPHNG